MLGSGGPRVGRCCSIAEVSKHTTQLTVTITKKKKRKEREAEAAEEEDDPKRDKIAALSPDPDLDSSGTDSGEQAATNGGKRWPALAGEEPHSQTPKQPLEPPGLAPLAVSLQWARR
jgi:hypothetical protein